MLSHAGMANAIYFEQLPVDEGVLGVHMKNAWAELMNVRHRIDELADQMAGVPFDAEVLAFRFIKEPLPHCRLCQHVEAHDRQMVGRHGAMFESNSHPFVGGHSSDGFPKCEQLRHEILEWLINRVISFWMPFEFDYRPGKTSDRLD